MIVRVVPYNPNWVNEYNKERQSLIKELGDVVSSIHHIGSTSVKGLAAKPIIDILMECTSIEAIDKYSFVFKKLDYEVMGEYGIAGRRYYRKGGDNRTHQIHAFKVGDPNIQRHIVFRDYLAAHPEVMAEYEKLKMQLASTCNNDISVYWAGKDTFIKHHESEALKWVAIT